MDRKFILSCESTVDLPYSYVAGRDIPVLFYEYSVGDKKYVDDMGRDPDALPNFYAMLDNGALPVTTQVNPQKYLEYFESVTRRGDVLHIAFSSGLSGSVNSAFIAAEMFREQHPDRRLSIIDSTCASSGYGLLVDMAADMRDSGNTLDEVESRVMSVKDRIQHQFFTTDMKFFRRSGRVSGATATIATILNICPLMRIDLSGSINAYSKTRGRKNAIAETIREMKNHAENGTDYSGKCFISHSNCLASAEETRDAIYETFPNLRDKVVICDIGTIIASHCGPGTVAVYFVGDRRIP